MLTISLAEDSNIMMHDVAGTGKTIAMVISMISHCQEEVTEVQVLCFTPSFEATMQLKTVADQLLKYTRLTCNTVTHYKGWDGIKSSILIGTSLELIKLVAEQALLDQVKLICFDDADVTIPFKGVSEKVLNCSQAKVLSVSNSMSPELMEMSKQRDYEVFKIIEKKSLELAIDHLMVSNKVDDKFDFLMTILSTMRPQDRAVVFCDVS